MGCPDSFMKKELEGQSEKPNGTLMSLWFKMTQLFSHDTLPLHFTLLGTLKEPHSHFRISHNNRKIRLFTPQK